MTIATSCTLPPADYDAPLVLTAAGDQELAGSLLGLHPQTDAYFRQLFGDGGLPTQAFKVSLHYRVPGLAAPCVAIVGCGPDSMDQSLANRTAGAAAKALAQVPRDRIGMYFGHLPQPSISSAICGALNGVTGQDLFRSARSLHAPTRLEWLLPGEGATATPAADLSAQVVEDAVKKGSIIGQSVLQARELVNLPANILTPVAFAERAAELAAEYGVDCEVWDELRLRRENCNAVLAVAAGSSQPPRMIVLRYPGKSNVRPVALVGKGVTFDSGGLSLKPSEGMLRMKCDMGGAATVLGTLLAVARLQLEQPVVAVCGLVENMVSGTSYKLGDVLRTRSGKTVEIHNTDAEGRLVLADALDVARQEQAAQIIDLATLTGACLVALGTEIAGLFSNHQALEASILAAARETGEGVWPMPMNAYFSEQIRSDVADIKNVGEGRWAGSITAAKFLEEFVGNTPWAHLDIAGPAFREKPCPHMDAGGTGAMVRTLVHLLEQWKTIS